MAFPDADSIIWLEAEQFEDTGGWTNDSQFMDQMGSPYLLAIGMGEPVRDAITHIKSDKAGDYRLWVRCKNWETEHSPGKFQVVINGKPIDHVFGESKKEGWIWENGGVFQLPKDKTEIRLHDLTGYYSRCDAIFLTQDLSFQPPDDLTSLTIMRILYGGISSQEELSDSHQFVVVGGGLAGCMAAVSAARSGCRTVLIHNRPVLGGNASTECLVPPVGVWPHMQRDPLDPRETGIIEEIRTEGNQTDAEAKVYSQRLINFCQNEANLDLYMNTHATGVELNKDSSIAAVNTLNVHTGKRIKFTGKIFADCTGDGIIATAAGAEYRQGREASSEFNESLAPPESDSHTMGNGLKYISQETSETMEFQAPEWAVKFPSCSDFLTNTHPPANLDSFSWQWKIEIGGMRDSIADAEEIRDEILRIIYGIWDHIKNHCPKLKEKAKNRKLSWVGHVLAKRETRRIIGDYIMTEHDIVKSTLMPDRIAYSSWGIDLHSSAGFYHDGPKMSWDGHAMAKGQNYSIPFRSLYSKDVDNLMMAGRNISVTHVALGAVRVMIPCGLMGEAVGMATALCLEYKTNPRGIYENHIDELQKQLLKNGCYIMDMPNSDPTDLARKAAITASSYQKGMEPEKVIDGYARADHGKPHSWKPSDTSSSQWLELDFGRPTTFNCIHISFQTNNHAVGQIQVEAADKIQESYKSEPKRRNVIILKSITSNKVRIIFPQVDDNTAVCEIRVYNEND